MGLIMACLLPLALGEVWLANPLSLGETSGNILFHHNFPS
jgi:hypothetical protein